MKKKVYIRYKTLGLRLDNQGSFNKALIRAYLETYKNNFEQVQELLKSKLACKEVEIIENDNKIIVFIS